MGAVALGQRRRRVTADRGGSGAVTRGQAHLREGLWRYVLHGSVPTALTAPVIYSLLVPFLALDVWVVAYQAICFRAWGVARVRRRDYLVLDRHRLEYLNGLEKMHCLYCSYANGLLAYVREVASRTEQYWCPIRHATRPRDPHERYGGFVRYGDARSYRTELPALRAQLKK
ncbi:MAG TPA: hypothetical protein VF491_04135 [Vicinamibacterales bacterium]|jgi:hypothetical protein